MYELRLGRIYRQIFKLKADSIKCIRWLSCRRTIYILRIFLLIEKVRSVWKLCLSQEGTHPYLCYNKKHQIDVGGGWVGKQPMCMMFSVARRIIISILIY